MTSPAKRPAVTYQKGPHRKIATTTTTTSESFSSTLNPDAALQQKINDLLFSKGNETTLLSTGRQEEEFDSAYQETTGNAKKVHDLVQVGETRRFIDEIEYLLDGLTVKSGSKSFQTVRASIEEIVEKCFNLDKNTGEYSVNVGFGMKLKSHGALGIIFESLNDTNDPVVLNNLILLISALLYDVRRLDFFFKPELAIKLCKHCYNCGGGGDGGDDENCDDKSNKHYKSNKHDKSSKHDKSIKHDKSSKHYKSNHDKSNNLMIEMLKCTQIFNKKSFENCLVYFAIWLLSKWSFSSVTTTTTARNSVSFFDLLLNDNDMIKKIIETCETFNETGEKAAGLLDCLLNRELIKNEEILLSLLDKIIRSKTCNLAYMKLAVSITGKAKASMITTTGSSANAYANTTNTNTDTISTNPTTTASANFFELVRNLINISFPFKEELEILSLSCLINLIDRSEDFIMDEFRYITYDRDCSLLQKLTLEYSKCPSDDEKFKLHKSLLLLVLGFICRQNRTNIEIISKTIEKDDDPKYFNQLKQEILTVATNFSLQQQQQADEDDDKIVADRLNEIILTFKNIK